MSQFDRNTLKIAGLIVLGLILLPSITLAGNVLMIKIAVAVGIV